VWAGEDDPDLPIDWAKPIRTVEAFDPAFSTAEGIRVVLPVVRQSESGVLCERSSRARSRAASS